MSAGLMDRIMRELKSRQDSGLDRALRVYSRNENMLNLADNDYLGLANDPEIREAAKRAIDRYGCSASASPLITGYGPAHEELLDTILKWNDFEYGIVWNSGYVANQALLKLLPQKGDLVLADRLIHNSMITGILASGARLVRYRHCNIAHLEALLGEYANQDRTVFVVTESVFSMDGDYPDLERIGLLKDRFDFFWIVDEAHAIGWYGSAGSGLVEQFGVRERVDVIVGTLGKALGSMGAYTLFRDRSIKEFVVNFAEEFIYSTFLAPVCAAVASEVIKRVVGVSHLRDAGVELSVRFRKRVNEFASGVLDGDSPIVTVPMAGNREVLEASRRMEVLGIKVGSIRPPTVPQGTSRLRISLKARLTAEEETRVIDALRGVLRESA